LVISALASVACVHGGTATGTGGAGGTGGSHPGAGGQISVVVGPDGGAGAGGAPPNGGGGNAGAAGPDGGGNAGGGSGGASADAGTAVLAIFDDALAGGAIFAPFGGATNATTIDTVDPHGGSASLRVEVPASGYTGGAFVAGAPTDLTRYTAVTFWARASAPHSLNVVGLGNDGTSTTFSAEWNAIALTATWAKYAVPIPLPARLGAATGLFHFAEGAEEGAYTFWLDDIQYEALDATVLGPPQPAIAGETLSKQTGDHFPVDGPSVTFAVNGGNQTLATARAYFNFSTSDATVATVDATGTITAVGVGRAVISATLGGTPAAGGITVNVRAASMPAVAAPAPTAAAADVISLLSAAYTSRAVDTWSASYDMADVADVSIAGVPTKQYTNLTFAGIEFFAPPAGPVDATAMTAFHLDVRTPTAAMLQVKLVDFGANASYAGGDDSESTMTFDAASTPALVASTWVALDIPLASFTGLAARAHLAQLLLTTDIGSTLFVENVYFHR